jgi:hypothetical protein
MLPNQKIQMAANFMKNKCFRRHLGLNRHFDFLAWQHCFYIIYIFILSELKHQKMRIFNSAELLTANCLKFK